MRQSAAFRVGVSDASDAGNSVYAVIKSGGKQYRVAAGDKIKVESVQGDVGQQVKLTDVLSVFDGGNVRFGAPVLSDASVLATVLAHGRHDKVTIFKMQRRKHFQKHAGHRQNYTELRIDDVQGSRAASKSGDQNG